MIAEYLRKFFTEPAVVIVRNIVACQNDYIRTEVVDSVYAAFEIPLADGAAAVEIAGLDNSQLLKRLGQAG